MIGKEEAKKDANDILLKLLTDLDNKETKKSKEQKRKIETYLKDEGVNLEEAKKEVKEKQEEEQNKNNKTIPFYVYKNEDNFVNRLEYRDYFDGEVALTKKPIMLFIKLRDIEKNYLYNNLKQLEILPKQCLAYPIFKYKCSRHGLIPSCEICWYAFCDTNEFCERMIKYCRLYGYGFKGLQLENPKWKIEI